MNSSAQHLIERLWAGYCELNPWANSLRADLGGSLGALVHDHVALRTVSHPQFGLARTARPFEDVGYRLVGEYDFPSKRLVAHQYSLEGSTLPDVFISELQLQACSRGLRDIIGSLARGVDHTQRPPADFAIGGRLWNPILHEIYDRLRGESKQAAWFAAFGFRAHRFAVLVEADFAGLDLPTIQARLERQGLAARRSATDGAGASQPLERIATIAMPTRVTFADGVAEVPGVRDAFVRRKPGTDGRLFRGFVDELTPPWGASPA